MPTYLRLNYLPISSRAVKGALQNAGCKIHRGAQNCDCMPLGGSAAGEHTAKSETQMWTLWVFEKAFLLCTFYFITSNFILCPSLIIFFLSVLLLNLQVCVLGPGKR